jgi:hypothetical protein
VLITAAQVGIATVHVLLAFPITIALYGAVAGVVATGLETLDSRSVGSWLRATAGRALRRLPHLLLTAAVLALALSVALPLVIGLFLLVRWSVAGPVAGLEGVAGIRALRRSGELVRGQTKRAAKVVFVSGLVVLTSLALPGLAAPAGAPVLLTYALLGVANAIAAPYVGLAWAFMYRNLAQLPTPEATARVA